jgi:hypothetical protein
MIASIHWHPLLSGWLASKNALVVDTGVNEQNSSRIKSPNVLSSFYSNSHPHFISQKFIISSTWLSDPRDPKYQRIPLCLEDLVSKIVTANMMCVSCHQHAYIYSKVAGPGQMCASSVSFRIFATEGFMCSKKPFLYYHASKTFKPYRQLAMRTF